jgi:hypothetical protein
VGKHVRVKWVKGQSLSSGDWENHLLMLMPVGISVKLTHNIVVSVFKSKEMPQFRAVVLQKKAYFDTLEAAKQWVEDQIGVTTEEPPRYVVNDLTAAEQEDMLKALTGEPGVLKRVDKPQPDVENVLRKALELACENACERRHCNTCPVHKGCDKLRNVDVDGPQMVEMFTNHYINQAKAGGDS